MVSDVLTASPTLERHLSALDFAHKVLKVEVMHSLNDFARLLNPDYLGQNAKQEPIPQNLTTNSISYRDYALYNLDKQQMLAFQDQKLIEYLELTKRRATRIYSQIRLTNYGLIFFGFLFLGLTFAVALAGSFQLVENVTTEFLAAMGIISAGSLIAVFIRRPIEQVQANLNNLVQLRAILDSHSLVQALMRHHFSVPERLYPPPGEDKIKWIEHEKAFLANLDSQIKMVQETAKAHATLFSGVGQPNSKLPEEEEGTTP